MSGYKVIWEEALRVLRGKMPDFPYQNFFAHAQPFYVDGGTYYFEQNTATEKALMERKYAGTVRQSIEKAQSTLGLPEQKIDVVYMTPDEAREYRDSFKAEPAAPPAPQEVTSDLLYGAAPVEDSGDSGLIRAYTFDTFVVGQPNEFANAAARAVSENPGFVYNPLFLYGGAGLGKTHLMHAIGNEVLRGDRSKRVIYVTSETFTNELIGMIRSAGGNEQRENFRAKYRKADVLMIDDIQFIAGKESTQLEFFNTFNELYNAHKQIVISSDRHPKELEQLDTRMRSRFESGLVAYIEAPDYETAMAILARKAAESPASPAIDEKVFDYIASQPNDNIRSLEGALKRVIAVANVRGVSRVERPLAEEALKDWFQSQATRNITPQMVCDVVCSFYNVKEEDLRGPGRPKAIVFPRHVAMYVVRDLTGMPHKSIAQFFNRKDHTTIMSAIKGVEKAMETDPAVRRDVEDIKAQVKTR